MWKEESSLNYTKKHYSNRNITEDRCLVTQVLIYVTLSRENLSVHATFLDSIDVELKTD